MKNFRAAGLALVVIFTLFLTFGSVFGQVKGVAITPLSFEFEAERGDVIEGVIKVANSSEENYTAIEMQAEDMLPQGEEGRVSLVRNTNEDNPEMDVISMARWIEFDEKEFQLDPKEEREVSFTISVPQNASPGGHYAGIIAGIPSGEVEGGGVGVTQRVAATTLLTIDGEMIEELSVDSFETTKNYYEGGPITFESRFKNTGTVHLTPKAKITVTDFKGREVANLDLVESIVLPNAVRKVTTNWDTGRLWGGKYTAKLEGVYGKDNQPLEVKEITFYAFPWKIALAGLLLVIFFILTRKRWYTIVKILIKGEAALKEEE
jgi:hypothetical protein